MKSSSPSNEPTTDLNLQRRTFLRRSLVVLGGAGAAVTGAHLCRSHSAAAVENTAGPTTHALTPDGQLIHICDGKVHISLPVVSNAEARKGIPGRKWIMVIDLAKCDGCGKCTEACSKCHFTPPDREWIKVFKMQENAEAAPYFMAKPCFQCDNPPCTKVCPVGATFKREDGIVLVDNERCIGCRFCMAACPYSSRFFNWDPPQNPPEAMAEPYSPERGYPRRIGTVEKCDFCPDMAARGELPHCTSGCPMGAIYYGDQNEDAVTNSQGETLRLKQLLKDRAGYRYMEELGTEPRLYYLPPKNRVFPAPGETTGAHDHKA